MKQKLYMIIHTKHTIPLLLIGLGISFMLIKIVTLDVQGETSDTSSLPNKSSESGTADLINNSDITKATYKVDIILIDTQSKEIKRPMHESFIETGTYTIHSPVIEGYKVINPDQKVVFDTYNTRNAVYFVYKEQTDEYDYNLFEYINNYGSHISNVSIFKNEIKDADVAITSIFVNDIEGYNYQGNTNIDVSYTAGHDNVTRVEYTKIESTSINK